MKAVTKRKPRAKTVRAQREQTSHPTKKNLGMSLFRATRSDYRSILSWREKGLNKQSKEALMQEYAEWADHDEAIDYLDFLSDIGVPFNTFCDWYQRNADLKELHIYVKQRIGARRQNLAFFAKKHGADSGAIRSTLRNFHPDWREAHDEDVKNKERESEGNVTVVLERIESTDVPEIDG